MKVLNTFRNGPVSSTTTLARIISPQLPGEARPSPEGRLKLLEPEVLERIDVVEIGKDPGTRGVSF